LNNRLDQNKQTSIRAVTSYLYDLETCLSLNFKTVKTEDINRFVTGQPRTGRSAFWNSA